MRILVCYLIFRDKGRRVKTQVIRFLHLTHYTPLTGSIPQVAFYHKCAHVQFHHALRIDAFTHFAKMPPVGLEPATWTPAAQTLTQLTKWTDGNGPPFLQTQN